MRRLLASTIVVASLLLIAGSASATPNFPPEMNGHLTLGYEPPCSVCHLNGVTGLGTVTTPFGVSMRARGCVANDTGSLDTALDALAAEGTDSDSDGVGDIQELKDGTDPNVAGGAGASTLKPVYGCGGGDLTAPIRPSVVGGLIGLLAIGLVTRRRRQPHR